MKELVKVLQINKWNGVEIEQHNGKFSLILKTEGKGPKAGQWFTVWCQLSNGFKTFAEKASPMKIPLGDTKLDAAANLDQLVRMLREMKEEI